MSDPAISNLDKYKVVFEDDRVRVLEYRDEPGQSTTPHEHPDSIMHTLSSFRRRLIAGNGKTVDVSLSQGETRWLDAQEVRAMLPALSGEVRAGVLHPGEGHANPLAHDREAESSHRLRRPRGMKACNALELDVILRPTTTHSPVR